MAKRREGNRDEVMLIPFLDILCSLIGVLVLIIVVLCVAQTQQASERTATDLAQAQQHRTLLKSHTASMQEAEALQAQVAATDKLRTEMLEKERQAGELRKRLASSGDAAKDLAASLSKQSADLLAKVAVQQAGIPPLRAEIEQLKRELDKRNIKIDAQALPIAIRPSGGGFSIHHEYFFIEVSGNTLVIHKSKTDKLRIPAAGIGTDANLNAFLSQVKATPQAALVFLLRDNGYEHYHAAAGYAESRFGLVTSKLPLPGKGEVDLNQFFSH